MSTLRESLQEGMALAARGLTNDAIDRLDAAFLEAIRVADPKWISLIGRNVAILCEHAGLPRRAVSYVRKILEAVPADRLAMYQLGQLLRELGDRPGSDRAFHDALRLAREENDQDLLDLLRSMGFR
jgi:tetratricopeptide (TPR) repeat protein